MDIQKMHSVFRTIGQQMGLQLIRGILPESIDVFINNIIQEKVQQTLAISVRTVIEETVDTQAATMNTTNLLRNLYKSYRYSVGWNGVDINNELTNQKGNVIYYNPDNSYVEILLPKDRINPMFYLGFSVEYQDSKRGNPISCRMIGADVLDTTLRDFCNGASKDSPILVLLNNANDEEYVQMYINATRCIPQFLNIKYVKNPNIVKYDTDINKCVNCDLPEYCHYEIVERAVEKYKLSIGGQLKDSNK